MTGREESGALPPDDCGSNIGAATARDLGWWAISGVDLLDALRRAAAGEDADLLYAELYANSDTESVEDTND